MTSDGSAKQIALVRELPPYASKPLRWGELLLLPNLISLGRILIIIPTVLLFPPQNQTQYWIVVVLLTVAYLSDMFDGLAARKLKQQSKLGLILDPVADKLWTIAMIFQLYEHRGLPGWVAVTIVLRDLAVLSFNAVLLAKRRIVMPSDVAGKSYMILLGMMIILMVFDLPNAVYIGYILVFLGGVTAGRYYIRFRLHL